MVDVSDDAEIPDIVHCSLPFFAHFTMLARVSKSGKTASCFPLTIEGFT
jgi:hypothetical protein